MRINPDTKVLSGYFRLVESYGNEYDRVCHRTILNVGFMEDTYQALSIHPRPFKKQKSVVHKPTPQKNQTLYYQASSP